MMLESERLRLRPIDDGEMAALIERERDPAMKQAYTEMLQGCLREPEERLWYAVWQLELKERPGTVVGDLCFKGPERDGAVEIGYGLQAGCCGKGYMTEAVKTACAWALAQPGVTRVEAETEPENIASQRVLAACGFVQTGMLGKEGPRYALRREGSGMKLRFAEEKDLERVNELRRQVSELHAKGLPGLFKPGFPDELRDFIRVIFRDPLKKILVCEREGEIVGFAVLSRISRPESPFKYGSEALDIDEFGVDEACRRQGIATAMITYLRDYAKREGFDRLELNMWEFNQDALAFYEAAGFRTYRRYMEIKL